MEPITLTIVSALVAGATAAAKDVATDAIKDAYAGLKRLVTDRYESTQAAVDAVDTDPSDSDEHKILAKRLNNTAVDKDTDVKAAALALLEAIDKLKDNQSASALFDFERLRVAKDVKLKDIEFVSGAFFSGKDVEVEGNFEVEGLRQTDPGARLKK